MQVPYFVLVMYELLGFTHYFVKKLDGEYVKSETNHRDKIKALRKDINSFRKENDLERVVMVWCGSTETYQDPSDKIYSNLSEFEKALDSNDKSIAPSILYAYSAIKEGVPYANGAPNLSVDIPAIIEFAEKNNVPIAGKDFKATIQAFTKNDINPNLTPNLD